MYVFDIFMFFVGCKGWEVDIENYRNGNNLWFGLENDRIFYKRKSLSRVSIYVFFKVKIMWYIYNLYFFIKVSGDIIFFIDIMYINVYINEGYFYL